MSDVTPNVSDIGIFEKPDERRLIDREREKYLNNGGLITVFPAVAMNSKGKREAVASVKMGFFKRGEGAKKRWYPGYLPMPGNRATPEAAEAFRAHCEERRNKTKRGRVAPTPVT